MHFLRYHRLDSFFFCNHTATTDIYTLSLHDALPISSVRNISGSSSRKASWPLSLSTSTKETLAAAAFSAWTTSRRPTRSEEHTSELQSHSDLVCRLLLEKKKHKTNRRVHRDHQEDKS